MKASIECRTVGEKRRKRESEKRGVVFEKMKNRAVHAERGFTSLERVDAGRIIVIDSER